MGDGLSVKVSRPFCMCLASDGLFFLPCRRIYCHVRRSYWSGPNRDLTPGLGKDQRVWGPVLSVNAVRDDWIYKQVLSVGK